MVALLEGGVDPTSLQVKAGREGFSERSGQLVLVGTDGAELALRERQREECGEKTEQGQ